jgi:hypothetical protein
MSTKLNIYQQIDKHFKKDRERARKEGYSKGYKDAMRKRWMEVLRGKSIIEKLQLIFK